MAADNRYYKRFNFESVPMEDYEVRDVARRSEAPDLEIVFSITQQGLLVTLMPVMRNHSPTPANYVVIDYYFDKRLSEAVPPGTRPGGEITLTVEDVSAQCRRYYCNHSTPGQMPVFQGVDFTLFDAPLTFQFPVQGTTGYVVGWQLRSPKMTTKLGGCLLRWEGTSISSTEKLQQSESQNT